MNFLSLTVVWWNQNGWITVLHTVYGGQNLSGKLSRAPKSEEVYFERADRIVWQRMPKSLLSISKEFG